ncbi:MAG: Flp pilus assembly complex ATPase component TadA [Magnetococcus sp. XQGC-1]
MKAAALNWITRFGLSLPAPWMARWQQNALLLILRDKETTGHLWLGSGFAAGIRFAQSLEGEDAFSRFLDDHPQITAVYLLVDVIEEELRTETVPRLQWGNRAGLIQQRLQRVFRQTPYRRADFQGLQAGNVERVLFSALTAPTLIQPWLDALLGRRLPVAGLWSVALLSRALMRKVTKQSTNALWVSLTGAGQRHTYFHQGRTLVSRLIPRRHDQLEEMAAAILAETNRTRLYLNTLRLLRRDVPLDVYVLSDSTLADSLQRQPTPARDCQIHPVLIGDLATRLDLLAAPQHFAASHLNAQERSCADLLLAEHLLLHPPANHYAPAETVYGEPAWLVNRVRSAKLTAQLLAILPDAKPSGGDTEEKQRQAQPVRRIGELLLEKGVISRHQLDIAVAEQKRSGHPFGKVLIALGFISEDAMRDLLGEALEQETINLGLHTLDAQAIQLVPRGFARRHGLLPLEWNAETNQLTVAMANTLNMAVLDKLQAMLPKEVVVRPLLASESELVTTIDRFYGFDLSVDGILREIETGEVDEESLASATGAFDHPMVRLVNALMVDALQHEASDMHINPMASFTQIRYRVDGVLQEARILNRKFFSGLSVRIKVMAGMDIAENRIPQDGHFSSVFANTTVDFRVSTQPTAHGENIVLRILNRSRGLMSLQDLGLLDTNQAMVKQIMGRPHGIILVTGPTGSGKTTTLYSMLSTLNAKKSNVMTLEDPVEYLLDAILQTSVNKAVELDFASGVRSILRQDPDIILVGEIRDLDTAQMALRAAMTGHQVYSTLHANSAVSAVSRLLNIGLRPDMLAGNIIGVLAQRLVRKLCLQCRKPVAASTEERVWLGLEDAHAPGNLYAAVGCPACKGTGYRGRICIMEGIIMDEDFDDLISSNAPQGEYRRLARSKGLLTMEAVGRMRVLEGVTSLEEMTRVFGTAPSEKGAAHA